MSDKICGTTPPPKKKQKNNTNKPFFFFLSYFQQLHVDVIFTDTRTVSSTNTVLEHKVIKRQENTHDHFKLKGEDMAVPK